MREIKFRGIATCDVEEGSIKRGQMIFGQVVYQDGRPYIVGPVVETDAEYIALESWCPVEPESLGQCVGLTDSKGADIYEGDVVEFRSEWNTFIRIDNKEAPEVMRSSVQFGHAMFYFAGQFGYEGLEIEFARVAVVGNIHESPELLEPKQ